MPGDESCRKAGLPFLQSIRCGNDFPWKKAQLSSISIYPVPAQKKSMWGDWQKMGIEMAEKWRKSALLPEKS